MTYHPEAGTLDILVLEASNLKKQDFIGLPSELTVYHTVVLNPKSWLVAICCYNDL